LRREPSEGDGEDMLTLSMAVCGVVEYMLISFVAMIDFLLEKLSLCRKVVEGVVKLILIRSRHGYQ
jgi:hypothetical protein